MSRFLAVLLPLALALGAVTIAALFGVQSVLGGVGIDATHPAFADSGGNAGLPWYVQLLTGGLMIYILIATGAYMWRKGHGPSTNR